MKHYSFECTALRLVGVDTTREFLSPIFTDRHKELLVVVLCDDQVRLLELLTSPGTSSSAQFSISDILRRAVLIGCSGLIVAHNHPSGDHRLSNDDVVFTRRLLMAAECVDVTLVDHLIFGDGPVFSCRKAGLL